MRNVGLPCRAFIITHQYRRPAADRNIGDDVLPRTAPKHEDDAVLVDLDESTRVVYHVGRKAFENSLVGGGIVCVLRLHTHPMPHSAAEVPE